MPALEPLWFKDAILYELHVRAFCDATGDGTGEFRGLAQKLDYLQDLGVTAIWLLPFYPSPLRDDGYDIADYTRIHPDYGSLDSFRSFLEEAHARGLKVITELVINHTSDQHPWFQRARRSPPGSPERDFYVWSDTPEKYSQARIIFKDFETSNWSWDKVAKSYFWHRFYSHQPDLNFDNPAVHEAILPVMDFWFDMGVDGMRLDAVPYLYEREGTNCENLPETHEYLKSLRRHVDEKYPGRMLLAEANQWAEDSVAYFGNGDECHMAFHFPVMPRLFMAMHSEDRLPIVDIMEQTPVIPDNCQWALFLRNHDELTLEMVTDEERDSMYKAYATDPRARINLGIRHRLAPLLGNNRRRIELMNGLLFSLPGTPVIYYGDEIGMGDNIYLGDRNGVRTPMQWSADRNAGFSRANPQKLYLPIIIDPEYHYEAVNVEAQQNNPNSLLWWTKRLIGLRRMHPAFSRGSLEFLRPLNRRVLAFVRRVEDETILVVANLSRFVQYAELDLSEFEGQMPFELFGATPFPKIGKLPYLMMLGPHSFYWFSLSKQETPQAEPTPRGDESIPELELRTGWSEVYTGPAQRQFEAALLPWVDRTMLSAPSPHPARKLRIRESVPVPGGDGLTRIVFFDVDRAGAGPQSLWLPVRYVSQDDGAGSGDRPTEDRIAAVRGRDVGWFCDATQHPEFQRSVLEAIATSQKEVSGTGTELVGVRGGSDWSLPEGGAQSLAVHPVAQKGFGSSVNFGEEYVLKRLPRTDIAGDARSELSRWLTESRHYPHAAVWLGALEYRRERQTPVSLAVLHSYVPNEGTAWQFVLDEVSSFFDQVVALPERYRTPPELAELPLNTPPEAIHSNVLETLGGSLNTARVLAEALADFHQVTAAATDDPVFAPEPFSTQYQRSLYQSLRNLASTTLYELRLEAARQKADWSDAADALLKRSNEIDQRFHQVIERNLSAWKIRVHGDCHLGQLLRAGNSFVITGYDRNLQSDADHRIRRSPLYDLAGMLRSFDVAAWAALNGTSTRRGRTVGVIRHEDVELLTRWADFWRRLMKARFIQEYRQVTQGNPQLSMSDAEFVPMLDVMLLERMLLELKNQFPPSFPGVLASLEGVQRQLDHPVGQH
jgi:maltose alpha-D-glucosyltransferase/alpha-amylase